LQRCNRLAAHGIFLMPDVERQMHVFGDHVARPGFGLDLANGGDQAGCFTRQIFGGQNEFRRRA